MKSTSHWKTEERIRAFKRLFQFCVVGGSGVLVDMGVLFLLADPRTLALNISLAKVCAAEIALINNFTWNHVWTFRDRHLAGESPRKILRRFVSFNVICGLGIGLSVGLLSLFYYVLGFNLYLANLGAILLVTAWNYGLNLKFSWGKPHSTPSAIQLEENRPKGAV
jgi:dolichol-phosphate mannosyltransferase